MPDIPTIESRIYNAARQGTARNPKGVPDQLAKLITSQTKHETATWVGGFMVPYTSNAFTLNNNAFGYKWVGSIYQIGPGIKSSEGDLFGAYGDYTDSVREMVDWVYRRINEGKFPANLNDIKTPDQYARLLKGARYYGDPQAVYTAGLSKWFTDNVGVTGSAGIVVLSLLSIWIFRFIKSNRK